MNLTILGSGNSTPQPNRASAGYRVELEAPILLDFGTGTFRNLARLDAPMDSIAAILISHLHVDHYADLLSYLFHQTCRADPRGPLEIFGPPGTASAVDHLRQSSPSLHELRFRLRVTEVHQDPFEVAGARVTPHEVVHSQRLTALAYRIDRGGRVLTYSGDSTACDALVTACRGADLAVLEATYPSDRTHPIHMNAEQACGVARAAGVRSLVLSHLDPAWDGRDVQVECAGRFDGPLVAASDLLAVHVGEESD